MSDSLNETGRSSLFERLLEAGTDAIVIVGGTGKIILVNAQTEQLFGYGRNELIGRDVKVLVPEHLKPAHSEHQNSQFSNLDTRTAGAGPDLYGRRRDGTEFPVEIGLTPLKMEEGTLTVETIRDITDRKLNERALQEQAQLVARRVEERTAEMSRRNAELVKANRMKDDFIARLAHELRTPLTSITGWVHLLEEGELGESKRKRALEVIDRNLTLQAQLIDDLLNASHIVSGRIQVDLQAAYPVPLIQRAIDSLRQAMEAKKLRLACDLDRAMGPLRIDTARFHQIVCNLLSNAVKFTPNGGRIQIAFSRWKSQAVLQISDSGEGIAQEYLPHVFDPFRQADASRDRKHAGLGVGLAIVKHLVELHGGKVVAESPGIGHGSLFSVVLPIPVFAVHPAFASKQAVPGRVALGGARILVIEDEPDIRDMIAQSLEQRNATTMRASCAEEAFSLLESQACDLLICDIGLPDIDGYSLVRRLRAIDSPLSRLPALALTAFAGEDNRKRALEAGFDTHLSKPVKLNEIMTVIVNLLGERRKSGT